MSKLTVFTLELLVYFLPARAEVPFLLNRCQRFSKSAGKYYYGKSPAELAPGEAQRKQVLARDDIQFSRKWTSSRLVSFVVQ